MGQISSMVQKQMSAPLRFWNSMCVQPQKSGDEPELQTLRNQTLCASERLGVFYFFPIFLPFSLILMDDVLFCSKF